MFLPKDTWAASAGTWVADKLNNPNQQSHNINCHNPIFYTDEVFWLFITSQVSFRSRQIIPAVECILLILKGRPSEVQASVGTPTSLGGRQRVVTWTTERIHISPPGIQLSWSLIKTRSGHNRSSDLLVVSNGSLIRPGLFQDSSSSEWGSEWLAQPPRWVTHLGCCVGRRDALPLGRHCSHFLLHPFRWVGRLTWLIWY